MHVLLAAYCTTGTDDCTLNFASSMLNFLNEADSSYNMDVNFVKDINEGLDMFARNAKYDQLILCNTRMAATPEMLKKAINSPLPFITGVYPLPTIDWTKVQDVSSSEDCSCRGLTYNADVAKASAQEGDYVQVRNSTLGVAVLKRDVISAILEQHGEAVIAEPQHMLYSEAIVDGRLLNKDENFCRMWGKDIAVDVEHPCSLTGPLPFLGCVGQREVLR